MDRPDDADITRFQARLEAFRKMSSQQRLELAVALHQRDAQARGDDAFNLIRAQFPSVAGELARSLAYHVYRAIPDATVDLLSWVELNLRDGVHERHAGLDFDLLYHLYNWLQAEALVPYGRQDVFEELGEIKECLDRDDKKSAVAILNSLIERFDGSKSPPDVE